MVFPLKGRSWLIGPPGDGEAVPGDLPPEGPAEDRTTRIKVSVAAGGTGG